MNLSVTSANLSFLLCGLTLLLGSLLIWAFRAADGWLAPQRLDRSRKDGS